MNLNEDLGEGILLQMNSKTLNKKNHSSSNSLEKFTSVVEMLTSNKLSKNNAFENRMIDNIFEIFHTLETKTEDSETIWQKYSTGVDSCAKIYGFCVDFLHSEIYKVLGGLNRTGNPDESLENDENNDNLETEKGKKKKKKIFEGAKTLEKDEKDITTSKFDKFDNIDPYFKAVSSKFNASTAAGLLLNNLLLSGSLEILIGEGDSISKTEKIEENSFISETLLWNYSLNSLFSEELCSALSNFIETPPIPSQTFQSILNDMGVPNDLFTESDSDHSFPEDSKDQFFDTKDDFEAFVPSIHERIASLAERDDYNFFSNSKVSAEFWKKTQVSGTEKKPQKKEKNAKILDFSQKLQKTQILPPTKKGYPNHYNETLLKKSEESNVLTAEDCHFTLYRLTQLFSRPRTSVKCLKNSYSVQSVVVDQVFVENKEDAQVLYAEKIEESNEFDYKENIKVASCSKTVDIKRLKDTMWKNLVFEKNKENYAGKAKNNSFLSLVHVLPQVLPSAEVASLSIHSCFITMLHLANEYNLLLKSEGPCDFSIKKSR